MTTKAVKDLNFDDIVAVFEQMGIDQHVGPFVRENEINGERLMLMLSRFDRFRRDGVYIEEPEEAEAEVCTSGTLWKRSRWVRQWRKRHVLLDGACISTAETDKSLHNHSYVLGEESSVFFNDDREHSFTLQIDKGTPELHFAADDSVTVNAWVEGFRGVIRQIKLGEVPTTKNRSSTLHPTVAAAAHKSGQAAKKKKIGGQGPLPPLAVKVPESLKPAPGHRPRMQSDVTSLSTREGRKQWVELDRSSMMGAMGHRIIHQHHHSTGADFAQGSVGLKPVEPISRPYVAPVRSDPPPHAPGYTKNNSVDLGDITLNQVWD